MKKSKKLYTSCIAILLLILALLSTAGCNFGKHTDEPQSKEQQSEISNDERTELTEREIITAMLGITLPESAVTEDYIHGIEPGGVEIHYFRFTVFVDSAEFEELEEQIIIEFGEAGIDYTVGRTSEYVYITHPLINCRSSGLNLDNENVEQIYFRFGTGGFRGESQPYTTRYVYAFIMYEEDGKREVIFSYGA